MSNRSTKAKCQLGISFSDERELRNVDLSRLLLWKRIYGSFDEMGEIIKQSVDILKFIVLIKANFSG